MYPMENWGPAKPSFHRKQYSVWTPAESFHIHCLWRNFTTSVCASWYPFMTIMHFPPSLRVRGSIFHYFRGSGVLSITLSITLQGPATLGFLSVLCSSNRGSLNTSNPGSFLPQKGFPPPESLLASLTPFLPSTLSSNVTFLNHSFSRYPKVYTSP